jgi:hypothetical protein
MSGDTGKNETAKKLICYTIVPAESTNKNMAVVIYLTTKDADKFFLFTQKFGVYKLTRDEDKNVWCTAPNNEYYYIIEQLTVLNMEYQSQDFVFDFNTGSAFCTPVKGQGTILGISMDDHNFVLDVLAMDEKKFSSKLYNDIHSN